MSEIKLIESKLLGEKCWYTVHKSGLRVYVFPKERTQYYAMFGTQYGGIDNCFKLEGDDEFVTVPDGIAHFLEHKMFENEDGVDTFERYAKFGASANAYTSNDRTCYLFSCTENFSDNLEILLDFVTHPYFTPATVEKEQGIIGQEIRMYEDNAGWALYQNLMNALYKVNNMRIDVAGTCESISHITADILYSCYRTFYNLNNMVLAVAGRLTPDEVLAVVDKVVKDAPAQTIIREYPEGETAEVNEKRIIKKMQVSRPMLYIGVKDLDIPECPFERQRKEAGMGILCDMLFSKSGRLYNELYDEGLISPNFGGFYDIDKNKSYFALSAESDEPETIFDRFTAAVTDAQKNGLDPAAFERCKRVAYADAIQGYESTNGIANGIVSNVFDGRGIFDWAEAVNSVDFDYVTGLLGGVFKPESCAMSVVMPLDK